MTKPLSHSAAACFLRSIIVQALCWLLLGGLSLSHAAEALFDRKNLAAWCVVPFDGKKRGPEERAAMLAKMGVRQLVYDYRAEHVPLWEEELLALKKHEVALLGWWFPTTLNEEAKAALALFRKHGLKPQLWVNGNGGPLPVKDAADQASRLAAEVARLTPICEAAAAQGCQVGLYNHGHWYGEPENAVAIVRALQELGMQNVGVIYNLHHAHGHLQRLAEVLELMRPYLLCVNLNGMDIGGDAKGRKILPIGAGTEDVAVLRTIRDSGYAGPIGLLNHTPEDAEGRLLDNLEGLEWVLAQVDGKPAGPRPKYRTWETTAEAVSTRSQEMQLEPSLGPEFGTALRGGIVLPGKAAYRELPFTIECRAKLDNAKQFNILVACDPKASAAHWEIYSYKGTGEFSLYLPGRGGEFRSGVAICDGKWHDLLASVGEDAVRLWVDGKLVLEKVPQPLKGEVQPGGLAIGQLVEGGLVNEGLIDDVRLSRGHMKPRKTGHPRLTMDNTLGLWAFDDAALLTAEKIGLEPVLFEPDRKPLRVAEYAHWEAFVNRERVFDFYGKQARAFRGKALPALLPAFAGLDGGKQGHWGNQNDQETWRDGRWAAADHGRVFSGVFRGAGLTLPKAVCVRLGEAGEMAGCFDPLTASWPLVWTGGFLQLSESRHGFMSGAPMTGDVVIKSPVQAPSGELVYHGFYRHGDRVVFSYSVNEVAMLDSAWVEEGRWVRTQGPAKEHALAELTKGGPARWPQRLTLQGEVGQEAPFAVDTIPIPHDNPFGTLFFLSGHDFFKDGRAAVATMTGEVWLVSGLDADLKAVTWKRFATGLHQPLGVKVVDDKVLVMGRDQITRLHDLNGDDEADFYECVTNAMESSPGGHDFITGLEQDAQGRFYFASGNQGVCRVAPTGGLEVLATGFRNPNGLGLSPDGRFLTTSVQEGDWTPASAICQIELGVNQGAHFGAGGPKDDTGPEPPLMYLPRGEDNSSGGQSFVSGSAWEALRGEGNLIHTSPGTGTAWLVMRQQVAGRWQGAAVRLSGSFDSGAQTARFHPLDGQLYVSGMTGWGCYAPDDGCLQRVRYVGGEVAVPMGFEARDNGVLLRFDRPLDAAVMGQAERHFAQCWNYRYSAAYGSPEFSVRHADTVGHDPLEVRSAQVLDGGKTLFLEIPQLLPASMVHLHVQVTPERSHDVFLTAHRLAEPFSDFAGYEKIAKTDLPQQAQTVPEAATVNPWVGGAKGRVLVMEAALGLQYVQKQLKAKAGERLSLHFKNPDVVPHNWMLAKPRTLKELGRLADLMISDPEGLKRHYVPKSDDVLIYTDMVNPGDETTIHFNAPTQPGSYPYLCTFPGHWMVMNGVLEVEE